MNKKIVVLKNDRTGDLFVSLRAINRILNKHQDQQIDIFLSNINEKFSFLFPNLNKKIISMNLSLLDKCRIFFYFVTTKIDTVYILTPKNFYYFLPFFFRKVKFYAITIKAKKSRPKRYLLKYLFKYIEINRLNISKRTSSYVIQEKLIESNQEINLLSNIHKDNNKFEYPKNFIFFNYKDHLFQNLLK